MKGIYCELLVLSILVNYRDIKGNRVFEVNRMLFLIISFVVFEICILISIVLVYFKIDFLILFLSIFFFIWGI